MNDKTLRVSLGILRSVIIAVGSILLLMIAQKSGTDETYNDGMANYGSQLDLVYNITIVALALCVIAALGFGLLFFLTNIKQRLTTLLGIVGFVVIGLISFYVLADGTVLKAYETGGVTVTEGESLFAGGGIYMTYILGAIALGAIIWAEVSKIFK
jgi:hypothetical protein